MRTMWTCRALLLMMAAAVPGAYQPAAAGDAVPFRGRAEAVITGADPQPDGLHLTLAGVGEATHLGRFSRDENVTLHDDFTLDGTLVFTAVNGDQLTVDFAGAFTSPTSAAGTYRITGGTGRFTGASGTAAFTAVALDASRFAVRFEGTLSF